MGAESAGEMEHVGPWQGIWGLGLFSGQLEDTESLE